jgi:glycosyltransferase involved in cell wall biosynthesis
LAKIIIITSRFPFPLEKGDKLRLYNQLKHFSKQHEVHLIAINHLAPTKAQLDALQPFCASIETFVIPVYKRLFSLLFRAFSQLPFQVSYFFSSSVKKKIETHIDLVQPDAVYCQLVRTSEYVKEIHGMSKTLDFMDCFSKGFKLKMYAAKNPLMKLLCRIEFKRLVKYERKMLEYFNHLVIISDQDRKAIDHPNKNKIEIISNGVDFNIFYPEEIIKKYDLLFSGNMGYQPNIDAAYYAATEILPLVVEKYPNIKMLIAGVNAPQKLKRLQSANLDVVEEFDHIRDAFLQSKINLVPVITSIGLQNKIVQALAMKIPTITTLAGARGINAEYENIVLTGETPRELALHIFTLLSDENENKRLQEDGYKYVTKHFSWEEHSEKLVKLLLQ